MLTTSQPLMRVLRAPSNITLFRSARLRHAALADYDSPGAALAALGPSSSIEYSEKDALTRALVTQYQMTREMLWAALLVTAYTPMLRRLSHRIRLNVHEGDEREQLVFVSFAEVIASISPDRRWFCLSLRRETERRVFRHLGRERRLRRVLASIDDLSPQQHEAALALLFEGGSPWPATRSEGVRGGLEPDEKNACVMYLREHAEQVLDDEDLALVTATLVHGHRLTDYVKEHHPDLDDISRQRLYQRLKRRHSRALAKLRNLLAERWEELRAAKAEAWPGSISSSQWATMFIASS